MPPNLFDYATKELSQDALICWLLKWAEDDSNRDLHALGRSFCQALLNHKSRRTIELPTGTFSVETHQQDGGIDVLARLDGRHTLLIEDKTGSGAHRDQLRRYLDYVLGRQDDGNLSKLGAASECDVHPIFFKTGNQSLSTEREIETKELTALYSQSLGRSLCSTTCQGQSDNVHACHPSFPGRAEPLPCSLAGM